jgi:ribonuclease HII
VDEVGRGPLAGPVVAAAVVLPADLCVDEATDSKALTAAGRERVAERVRRKALGVGIGAASPREIDARGIVTATRLALERALEHLPLRPDHVVVDGRPVKGMAWEHDAVIKGDYRVHCVACASIVAKECRDRLMVRLHERYPVYGWDRNKGYGTAAHLEALRSAGPSPHHRTSFGGVDAQP